MSITNLNKKNENLLYEVIVQENKNFLDDFMATFLNSEEYDTSVKIKILFKVYQDVKIKGVPISKSTEDKVLENIVKLHYKNNETKRKEELNCKSSQNYETNKQVFIEYFKRVQIKICNLIEELSHFKEVNNMFLLICSHLSNKVHSAKRLCKLLLWQNKFEKSFLYLIFPWDQIQFILNIFVFSYNNKFLDETILYACIISQRTLIKHLNYLLNDLQKFNIEDTVFEKKLSRGLNSGHEDSYSDLFHDFWLLKNIYSLKIINDAIELAISIDYDDDFEFADLSLSRCLLIIGEYTKCTPESPHISDDLKFLLADLSPKDLQESTKKIRNDLSHIMDKGKNPNIRSKTKFTHVQKDLSKVVDSFHYAFEREKFKAIHRFALIITKLDTVDQIFDCFPIKILSTMVRFVEKFVINFDSLDFSSIRNAIQQLEKDVSSPDVQKYYSFLNYLDKNKINIKSPDYKSINKVKTDFMEATGGIFINETNNELEAIREIETLNLFYQLDVASMKISLKIFSYHISILNSIPNLQKTNLSNFMDTLKRITSHLHDFPYNNILMLRYIKDNIDSIGRMIKHRDSAVLVLEFLRNDKYELKILEEIKNISRSLKVNFSQNDITTAADLEVKCIVESIREYLKDDIGDSSNISLTKLDQEIGEYKRITELIETVQQLANEGDKTHNFLITIERVKLLIGERKSELDLKMIDALDKRHFRECLDSIKKKYKGKRKCKYENLVRAFIEPQNSNLEMKIKLVCHFLKKINVTNFSVDTVKKIVLTKYLSALEDVFNKLKRINEILRQDTRDRRLVKKLLAASEMALLQILEQGHKFGGGEDKYVSLFMTPDILLHCGKSLRNFLAHLDNSYKKLILNPDQILPFIASEICRNGVYGIPNQNYFIRRENINLDYLIEETFETESRKIMCLQMEMFEAIKNDDLNRMVKCIDAGAEPRSTDVYKRNTLQVALDQLSVHCFLYLVYKYQPISILVHTSISTDSFNNSALMIDISNYRNLINMIHRVQYSTPINNKHCIKLSQNCIKETVENIYNFVHENLVHTSSPSEFISMLHIAASSTSDNNKLIETILNDNHVDVNVRDIYKNSSLHWAATLGFQNTCQILIDKGADIWLRNQDGRTPMDLAILECNWKTVDLLFQNGSTFKFFHEPSYFEIFTKEEADKYTDIGTFLNCSNQFQLFEFSYALFTHNNLRKYLLSLLLDVENNMVIQFGFAKTIPLIKEKFKELVLGFIMSCACLFNRQDIVELIIHEDYSCDDIHNYVDSIADNIIFETFFTLSYFKMACLGGSREVMTYLIEHGVDTDECEQRFQIGPVHLSIIRKDIQTLKYLIEEGTNFNTPTNVGLTPFHIASISGDSSAAQVLIENNADLLAVTNHFRHTALHLAAQRGFTNLVKLIITATNILDMVDKFGNTPLHLAALNSHREVIELLLQNQNNNLAECINDNNMTSIHCAVLSGNVEILRVILRCLSDSNKSSIVNMKVENNNEFNSRIAGSCGPRGYKEINDLYSSISAIAYGSTALHIASMRGHNEMVQILIRNKAEINCTSTDRSTPLLLAVKEGHIDVVQTLLSNSSSVTFSDKWGNNVLHRAAYHNHPDIVKILLDQIKGTLDETMINCKNKCYTPLHMAAMEGHYEVTRILIKRGADINVRVLESGETALHLASNYGHYSIVEFLLESGANVNALCYNFQTPLYRAVQACSSRISQQFEHPYARIMELLIHNGAWTDTSGSLVNDSLLTKAFMHLDLSCAESLIRLNEQVNNETGKGGLLIAMGNTMNTFRQASFTLDNTAVNNTYQKAYLQRLSAKHLLRRKSAPDDLLFFIKRQILKKKLVDSINYKGKSELHRAVSKGEINEAKLLIAYGADINCQTLKGLTPLHLAVQKKNHTFVLFLLEANADPFIPCYTGITPLMLAIQLRLTNITELIKRYMNKIT